MQGYRLNRRLSISVPQIGSETRGGTGRNLLPVPLFPADATWVGGVAVREVLSVVGQALARCGVVRDRKAIRHSRVVRDRREPARKRDGDVWHQCVRTPVRP